MGFSRPGLLIIAWIALLMTVIAKNPIRVSSKTFKKRKSESTKRNKWPSSKSIIPVKRATAADKLSHGASVLLEYFSISASKTISSVDKLRRDMKVFFASDYETLLLRLTRPNQNRPLQADLERFLATTASFVRNFDLVDPNNPYRVTLRKVWRKLIENDSLTNIKAEYLLLSLIRNSEPEDALIYRKLLLKMSQEVDKKSGCQYFDWVGAKSSSPGSKVLLAKDSNHDQSPPKCKVTKKQLAITPFPKRSWTTKFAQRFFQYITLRMKTFTSDFQEMKLISIEMRAEDICAQFAKAIKVMDACLQCKVQRDFDSQLAVICYELLAYDLHDIFQLYTDRLDWLIKNQSIVFRGKNEEETGEILDFLVNGFLDRRQKVSTFLKKVRALLKPYKLQVPSRIASVDRFNSTMARRM